MKRFIFLSVTVYFVLMGLMSNCQRVTHVSTLVKLQRAMRLTQMAEYHDDDYGYTVRYPVFFQRSDDTMMDKVVAGSASGATISRWCSVRL